MKADAIHYLTGATVIAVPGVNSLNHLEEILLYAKENGTTRIMTAFDMDYLRNPFVRDAYQNLSSIISKTELEYGTYLWDPKYKGLDDYIWFCRKWNLISAEAEPMVPSLFLENNTYICCKYVF